MLKGRHQDRPALDLPEISTWELQFIEQGDVVPPMRGDQFKPFSLGEVLCTVSSGDYRSGENAVPHLVELVCLGWEVEATIGGSAARKLVH
ncbi:hypothetical protein QTH97_07910 [Variovorax sp. J22R24]|uniref:hypothetical protein n=1 Tax=Variovorax gracilis TaxID=3053502 RepID=UPI0025751AD6|nr:hypothetical protein [Variovorax sp. J22R24]MDM0104854.1 hypothetical protein [Variovorax sp. J22R24]